MDLLFVTWDGPSSNYLLSLYWPMLSQLADEGNVAIYQFGWGDSERAEETRQRLGDYQNVQYEHIALDGILFGRHSPLVLLLGAIRIRRHLKGRASPIVLTRSILPAAMMLIARLTLRKGSVWIFDADGFPAEERRDFAGWADDGFAFRIFRWVEERAVIHAKGTLVRTRSAAESLVTRTKVCPERLTVVPNGRDPTTWKPIDRVEREARRASMGIPIDAPLLVYVGSYGAQYRFHDMLSLHEAMRISYPESHLLILVPEYYVDIVKTVVDGLAGVIVTNVVSHNIAPTIAAADVGLAFRSKAKSQDAVSPIKVAEYLLCGTPVLYSGSIEAVRPIYDCPALRIIDLAYGLEEHVEWVAKIANYPHLTQDAREAGISNYSLDRMVLGYRRAIEKA